MEQKTQEFSLTEVDFVELLKLVLKDVVNEKGINHRLSSFSLAMMEALKYDTKDITYSLSQMRRIDFTEWSENGSPSRKVSCELTFIEDYTDRDFRFAKAKLKKDIGECLAKFS